LAGNSQTPPTARKFCGSFEDFSSHWENLIAAKHTLNRIIFRSLIMRRLHHQTPGNTFEKKFILLKKEPLISDPPRPFPSQNREILHEIASCVPVLGSSEMDGR